MEKFAFIDLHIHTKHSFEDGCDISVADLLDSLQAMAEKENKDVCFSITDHENMLGCIEAADLIRQNKSKYKNLRFIPGIEFNTSLKEFGVDEENNGNFIKCHLLGYGFNVNDENLIAYSNLMKKRTDNNKVNTGRQLVFALKEIERAFNVELPFKDFNSLCELSSHKEIRKAFVNKISASLRVNASDVSNIIEPYFYSEEKFNEVAEGNAKQNILKLIKLIHRAGGKTCIAHAKTIRLRHPENYHNVTRSEVVKNFISSLQLKSDHGIDAIELFHNENTASDIFETLYDLAKQYDMFITGGSDYHGGILHPNKMLAKCCSKRFEYMSIPPKKREKFTYKVVNKLTNLAFVDYMLKTNLPYKNKQDFVLNNAFKGNFDFDKSNKVIESIKEMDYKAFNEFYKIPKDQKFVDKENEKTYSYAPLSKEEIQEIKSHEYKPTEKYQPKILQVKFDKNNGKRKYNIDQQK